jgi:hypothetical protein
MRRKKRNSLKNLSFDYQIHNQSMKQIDILKGPPPPQNRFPTQTGLFGLKFSGMSGHIEKRP